MSGISSATGYGTTITLADILAEDSPDNVTSMDVNQAKLKMQKAMMNAGYGALDTGTDTQSARTQAALKRALEELSQQSGGTVTFSDIRQYQQDLEKMFTAGVRMAVTELGVDPDSEFTLRLNNDGKIQVITDDPAEQYIIQSFLKDNPKVCEEFGYIQALANLEKARQSPAAANKGYLLETQAGMNMNMIQSFFSDVSSEMMFPDMLAHFGGGDEESVKFYSGIDFSV